MSQNPSPPSLDRTERAGSPGLVLALAGFLVAVMAAFSFMPHEQANRLILVLLAVLAFVGISGLLAYAVGFVQISGAQARNDLTKIIVDTSSDGMVVTEGESRIVYANEAYMALAGAVDAAGLRTVDRLFSGAPEVSEPLYRLSQAARDGKRGAEELRLTPPLLGDDACGRSNAPPGRSPRSGPSPTSPASASATKTCFRNCSTPSIFSITRRLVFSPPIPAAIFPT